MKRIKLTKGQYALVDDADYPFLSTFKWYAQWSKNTQSYYARRSGRRSERSTLMHRAIMQAVDGVLVDHRNHNTLDNRRRNLRIATMQQNQHNHRKYKTNTTGYTGVCVNNGARRKKRFMAYICFNGKKKTLGYFASASEASDAHKKAARELFGDFAHT